MKTFYSHSVDILGKDVAEAYSYRRNKETLGVLYYTISTGEWNVLDYMNNINNSFESEKQARKFIKEKTPIFI